MANAKDDCKKTVAACINEGSFTCSGGEETYGTSGWVFQAEEGSTMGDSMMERSLDLEQEDPGSN